MVLVRGIYQSVPHEWSESSLTHAVNISLGASIAEIVSAYPTAGGVYTVSQATCVTGL